MRVLCSPRLRWPSRGSGWDSGGCASHFRSYLGAAEPGLCAFVGCRSAEARSATHVSHLLDGAWSFPVTRLLQTAPRSARGCVCF